MKIHFYITLFLLAFGTGFAQYLPNQAPPEEEPPASTRELDPEEWDGEIGEDEKIPEFGHVIETEEGAIQAIVWKNKLRIYFLDEENRVVEPPVSLATCKLMIVSDSDEFDRLKPRGDYMEGMEFLRPPFIIRMILRLHREDDAVEDDVYSFMFRQDYIP